MTPVPEHPDRAALTVEERVALRLRSEDVMAEKGPSPEWAKPAANLYLTLLDAWDEAEGDANHLRNMLHREQETSEHYKTAMKVAERHYDALVHCVEAVGAHVLGGDFTLRSGEHSSVYIEWPNSMRAADVRDALTKEDVS